MSKPNSIQRVTDVVRKLLRPPQDPGIVESFLDWTCSEGISVKPLRSFDKVQRAPPRTLDGQQLSLFQKEYEISPPPLICAELRNCAITGIHGFIILPDGRYLLPFQNGSPEDIRSHPDYFDARVQARNRRNIPGLCVSLLTFWMPNFYHWFFDVINFWLAIQDYVPADGKYVLPASLNKFQRQSLAAVGFPINRAIFAEPNELLAPESLWYAPHPWRSRWQIPELTNQLREKLTAGLSLNEGVSNRRLFISREDASVRRLVNSSCLLSEVAADSLDVLQMKHLTLQQQATAFRSASLVIAPHGAALTNLIYCRPGTKVIEIQPAGGERPFYWSLACLLDLDYRMVQAMPVAASGTESDLRLTTKDIKSITRYIDEASHQT